MQSSADPSEAVPPAFAPGAPAASVAVKREATPEPLADVNPALVHPRMDQPVTPTPKFEPFAEVEDVKPFASTSQADVKPFASQHDDVKPFATPSYADVDVKPNVTSPTRSLGRGKRARKAVKYDDGDGDGDDDDFDPNAVDDDFDSPQRKRGKRAPGEKSLKKEAAAERRANKEDWAAWVASHQWNGRNAYAETEGLQTINKTEAMKTFRLKAQELNCLFYNKHSRDYDGRAYAFDEVRNLVYRKHAYLNGLHKKGLDDTQLLTEGRELYAADEARLDEWHTGDSPRRKGAPGVITINKRGKGGY